MRTLLALALILTATTADAKPRHHARRKPADSTWVRQCVAERTSSTVTAAQARASCKAEEPDDEVSLAKRELAAARHRAKIAKLADRAAKALEACEEAVSLACEDTTERATDAGECSDATLRAAHRFDVCLGHGPAWAATEGK